MFFLFRCHAAHAFDMRVRATSLNRTETLQGQSPRKDLYRNLPVSAVLGIAFVFYVVSFACVLQDNVAVDFRGTGVLALKAMVFFCQNYERKVSPFDRRCKQSVHASSRSLSLFALCFPVGCSLGTPE